MAALTKQQIIKELAGQTELSKVQVMAVLDGLSTMIQDAIGKDGPGSFNLHGLLKIKRVDKPAAPAHSGVNPFTKKPQDFPAKPARSVVKALPLKPLKDAVAG